MELLKQAMLRHEILFRDQVRELHRLYWTQRSLMMCRSLTEDAKMGLDVALPLDLLKNQQGSLETKGFGYGDEIEGSRGEINLSTQKNQSVTYKTMHFDLNVAPDDESLSAWHDPVQTILSSSMNSLVIQPVASVISARSQSFISFSRESSNNCSKETSTGVQPIDSRSASKVTINAFGGWQVSHHSGTDASACDAQGIEGACDNNQRKVENKHHGSDSDAPLKFQMNSAEVSYNGFGGKARDNVTEKMLAGILGRNLVSSSREQVHHVHSHNRQQASTVTSSDNAEDTNLRTSIGSAEQRPAVTRDSENKQANFERSEEATLSSDAIARDEERQDKCSNDIPVESKSGNEQCSGDVSQQKLAIVPSITEESGTTQTELHVLETHPIKHSLVSQTCGPSIIEKSNNEDELECDSLVFLAAKTLFSISSHKPECVTDQASGFRLIDLGAEGREELQYSSDSFETLTMMLPENTSDEYTMPMIPAEKVSGNDACRVKLRRGRGLQDFQKDILPGLKSLSRHEICEDFHSIEHALTKSRSRNKDNWPVPVQSRRSRRYRCTPNKRQL